MTSVVSERVLMRIHISESDHFDGKPLYQQIVKLLHDRKVAGATVLRGIMGFGASAKVHTDRFVDIATDLPIVVECVDTNERLEEILPELDRMITGGMITLERVQTRIVAKLGRRE